MLKGKPVFAFILASILLAGSVRAADPAAPKKKRTTLQLESLSFKDNGTIPARFTCAGENVSPEMEWKNGPAKTKSYALICEDPDAPLQEWVHWVVFNIPKNVFALTEALPRDERFPNGISQGVNDFKNIGYGGPCPPAGAHRYYFKLYALDKVLDLNAGSLRSQVEKAMKGHILAWTQIMGLYGKQ